MNYLEVCSKSQASLVIFHLIALCCDFLLCCLEKGLPANNDFFSFSSSKYCEHTCPVWKIVNVFCYFHHTWFISLLYCLILRYY